MEGKYNTWYSGEYKPEKLFSKDIITEYCMNHSIQQSLIQNIVTLVDGKYNMAYRLRETVYPCEDYEEYDWYDLLDYQYSNDNCVVAWMILKYEDK